MTVVVCVNYFQPQFLEGKKNGAVEVNSCNNNCASIG